MKAKIDVTIFHNGDMDILHASIYEELWKDYCTFKKRAAMQQEKGTKKGTFLARRYYRAALLSLFAFFEGVLNNWIKTIIQERQEFAGVERQDTLKKCDAMVEYCFFCSYTKRPGTFCSLYGYIDRYEQHDLALIEHIDGQTLGRIETAMEEFFCYVEAMTALRRFPKPNESTTGLVSRLGGMVKDCRG